MREEVSMAGPAPVSTARDKKMVSGLKWIRRAIFAGILYQLLLITIDVIAQTLSVSIVSVIIIFAMTAVTAMIGLAVSLFTYLAILAGTLIFGRTKDAISPEQRKDLRFGIASIIVYFFASLVLPFASGFLAVPLLVSGMDPISIVGLSLGLLQALNAVSVISLALAVILPIRRSVPPNQRGRLYLYGMLVTLLFVAGSSIAVLANWNILPIRIGQIISIILSAISLIVMFIPLGTYTRTIKVLDGRLGPSAMDKGRAFLREDRLPNIVRRDLQRPWIYMVYALFIGIVLAVPVFFSFDDRIENLSRELMDDLSEGPLHFTGESEQEVYTMDDEVNEGETLEYFFSVPGCLTHITIELRWVDEDPGIRFENYPDTFSMLVDHNGTEQSDSSSNDPGGEGIILLEMSFDEEEGIPIEMDMLTVYVTLDDAGDMPRRLGLGIIGLVDDSNSFTLTVTTDYLVVEE